MLEGFVFVSGFVLGFQVRTKGRALLSAKYLILHKFKRLIIPSIIFSICYILLFGDIHQSPAHTIYDIVNGAGHMWFLPMLFWCFIAIWIIGNYFPKPRIVLPILLVLSICPEISLPFRLSNTQYYLFYFYAGYCIQGKQFNLTRFYKTSYAIALSLVFLVLFYTLTMLGWRIPPISRIARIIYSSLGLVLLFYFAGIIDSKCPKPLPGWILKIGSLCMGVYLVQQFILKALYQHTSLPTALGPIWLPWAGFIIALTGSALLVLTFKSLQELTRAESRRKG